MWRREERKVRAGVRVPARTPPAGRATRKPAHMDEAVGGRPSPPTSRAAASPGPPGWTDCGHLRSYTYRIKAINEYGVSERSRWFHTHTPAAP